HLGDGHALAGGARDPRAIEAALEQALKPEGERVHVFSHLSHLYPDGSNIYVTYVFRLSGDPERDLERWRALKGAASRAIVEQGGTISHQHGVGLVHKPYLEAEKGTLGLEVLRQAAAARSLGDHEPRQAGGPVKGGGSKVAAAARAQVWAELDGSSWD